jgi:hypothetical protein
MTETDLESNKKSRPSTDDIDTTLATIDLPLDETDTFTDTIDLPLDEIDTIANLPTNLQSIYIDNWTAIQTHSNINKHISTHTYFHSPLDDHVTDWYTKLDELFTTQTKRFKINYSHHTILKEKHSDTLRFFHASSNNASVLDVPKLINNRQDFNSFIDDLTNSDILEFAQHNRPNTKYTVETIPATSFYIYHLNEFPIG